MADRLPELKLFSIVANMHELPPCIRKNAEELRKIRLSQRWTSYEEALKQCRAVELHAASASSAKSKGSGSGRPKKIAA